MDCFKKAAALILVLPIIFGACLNLKQPRNKIEYYSLEYVSPQIDGLKRLPHVIRLERFTVAPTYNTDRIIYRDQSFKREAYVYYRWRANPGDLVTHFLGRDIRKSQLFKAVLPHDSRFESSYMLEGAVDEFLERDTEETWKAVLSLSITLMAENEPDISKKIIFQKSYRATEACNRRHPRALAEAMSRAMGVVSGEIIRDIHDHLEGRK